MMVEGGLAGIDAQLWDARRVGHSCPRRREATIHGRSGRTREAHGPRLDFAQTLLLVMIVSCTSTVNAGLSITLA
jgi:hypothetical protein